MHSTVGRERNCERGSGRRDECIKEWATEGPWERGLLEFGDALQKQPCT